MTSQIVTSTLDEDFPVAGQDNDSQGFRDNFSVIKTGLETAASEISVLQETTAKLGSEENNDFLGGIISNAQTNGIYGTSYSTTATTETTSIDFTNGDYQIVTLTRNTNLRFENWPESEMDIYSKLRIAVKTDGIGNWLATFTTQGGELIPLQGASDSYNTGTDIDDLQVVEVWTSDNGDTVFLTSVGDS
jgi:hypothetical protein